MTFTKIYDLVEKELKENKKRSYINTIIDMNGHVGIVYEALESMFYHGKLVYPITYKYRKELSKWYCKYIREQRKNWEARK